MRKICWKYELDGTTVNIANYLQIKINHKNQIFESSQGQRVRFHRTHLENDPQRGMGRPGPSDPIWMTQIRRWRGCGGAWPKKKPARRPAITGGEKAHRREWKWPWRPRFDAVNVPEERGEDGDPHHDEDGGEGRLGMTRGWRWRTTTPLQSLGSVCKQPEGPNKREMARGWSLLWIETQRRVEDSGKMTGRRDPSSVARARVAAALWARVGHVDGKGVR
jgi:hypothetical protein